MPSLLAKTFTSSNTVYYKFLIFFKEYCNNYSNIRRAALCFWDFSLKGLINRTSLSPPLTQWTVWIGRAWRVVRKLKQFVKEVCGREAEQKKKHCDTFKPLWIKIKGKNKHLLLCLLKWEQNCNALAKQKQLKQLGLVTDCLRSAHKDVSDKNFKLAANWNKTRGWGVSQLI